MHVRECWLKDGRIGSPVDGIPTDVGMGGPALHAQRMIIRKLPSDPTSYDPIVNQYVREGTLGILAMKSTTIR